MAQRESGFVVNVAALQYALMDRLRDRRALEASRQAPRQDDFSGLAHARQCLLVTYRRSGEPVPSPVNFGLGDDGKLYLRTDGNTAKVARLRADPRVLIIPCGLRGTPRGPAAAGTARILSGEEVNRADRILASNWTAPMKLLERGLDQAAARIGMPIVYVEVTPAPDVK